VTFGTITHWATGRRRARSSAPARMAGPTTAWAHPRTDCRAAACVPVGPLTATTRLPRGIPWPQPPAPGSARGPAAAPLERVL